MVIFKGVIHRYFRVQNKEWTVHKQIKWLNTSSVWSFTKVFYIILWFSVIKWSEKGSNTLYILSEIAIVVGKWPMADFYFEPCICICM